MHTGRDMFIRIQRLALQIERRRFKGGSDSTDMQRQGGASEAMVTTETRTCYKCQKPGHIARGCTNAKVQGAAKSRDGTRCDNCGKVGHIMSNCWSQGGGAHILTVNSTGRGGSSSTSVGSSTKRSTDDAGVPECQFCCTTGHWTSCCSVLKERRR